MTTTPLRIDEPPIGCACGGATAGATCGGSLRLFAACHTEVPAFAVFFEVHTHTLRIECIVCQHVVARYALAPRTVAS
jgi:hypothetical protein